MSTLLLVNLLLILCLVQTSTSFWNISFWTIYHKDSFRVTCRGLFMKTTFTNLWTAAVVASAAAAVVAALPHQNMASRSVRI